MKFYFVALLLAFLISCGSSSDDPQPNICPGEIIGDISLPSSISIVNADSEGKREISGTATNFDASVNNVVLWAKTDKWYIQPLINNPYTEVCSDGRWTNVSHPWNRIVALLVNDTYSPGATREQHPSSDTGVLAWDEFPEASRDRTITFSGHTWHIKSAFDAQAGPGPNYFSDLQSDVWVDAQGLHLTTVKREGRWFSTEVYLPESLGYGSYTFHLSSPVDNLDQRAVFAGFVYESAAREIDIEFSKILANPNNAQYVVQPWTTPGNIIKFDAEQTIQTSHRFVWTETDIQFISWIGHNPNPPNTGSVIQEWTYTGSDIPPPGSERMRFNLWLFDGLAPLNDLEDEVIIESFTFTSVSA